MKKKTNIITKPKVNTVLTDNNEITSFIRIILMVLSLFIVFYLITYYVTNKKTTPAITETAIQYKEIIVGNLLNQTPSEYYVLATIKSDTASALYIQYQSMYEATTAHVDGYTINLDNGFNKPYISDASKLLVSNANDIRFKTSTLLHIKNKIVIKAYEGKDAIINYYKLIIK